MRCQFQVVKQVGAKFRHRCQRCKGTVTVAESDPANVKAVCGVFAITPHGPGRELLDLFAELGIKPRKECGCKAYARQMNQWGVAGCRDRRGEIVAHLQSQADKFGLGEWAAAGWQAVVKGLPLTLAGLVDLAIDRAESGTGESRPAAPAES
jgi:hypothetical protein